MTPLTEMHKDPEFAAVVRAVLLRYVARPMIVLPSPSCSRRHDKIWRSLRSQVFFARAHCRPRAPLGCMKAR